MSDPLLQFKIIFKNPLHVHVMFVILIAKFRGSTLTKHDFCQSQQDAVWIFLGWFSDDPDTVKHCG